MNKKVYTVTVGTRNRITVPFDAWMDAKCNDLVINVEDDGAVIYPAADFLQKNMSYRITLYPDVFENFKPGMKVNLTPIPSRHLLNIKIA